MGVRCLGGTASRQRLFVCRPTTADEETPCARRILSAVAKRAYRRPVVEDDLKTLMRFYATNRGWGHVGERS